MDPGSRLGGFSFILGIYILLITHRNSQKRQTKTVKALKHNKIAIKQLKTQHKSQLRG